MSALFRNRYNLLMMLVALFVFFVGLYSLGDARISHDELKTLRLVEQYSPFEVLVNFYSFNHIFFSFLLDLVYRLTAKFYLMRWVPVGFGVLAVVLSYRAGKTLLDRRTALVAAFLVVITPIFIQYLREMRGYSATVFFSQVILICLWGSITTRRKGYWIGFVIASVLGVYTHLYFSLALVAAAVIIALEWLLIGRNRQPKFLILKPALISFAAVGFILALLHAPIVHQILTVPQEQELRMPVFGPFSLTWDFWQGFIGVFQFFNPVGLVVGGVDLFFILVLWGCVSGLRQPARRRPILWLLLWWQIPFWANLLVMLLAPGSSAQIRFHLHTLPAYLLLGTYGLFTIVDFLATLTQKVSPSRQIKMIQQAAAYVIVIILVGAIAIPNLVRSLDEKTDEAWTAVAAYLRSEVRPGDIILCEAFELHSNRGGNDGSCGWQLRDIDQLIRPAIPNQSLSDAANFRGAEGHSTLLQQPGRVWFVIYFNGPPPYPQEVMDAKSELTVRQFRSTWVVRGDSGQTLLENLIGTGQWLLDYIPAEKHRFGYNLDLAQLYALAGDLPTANSHLERAFQIQQASNDPDWGPELAQLREVTAVVRFYAPVPPAPEQVTEVNFDQRLKLIGYAIEPDRLSRGSEVKVSFYWQTIGAMTQDYFVLVHLKDVAGNTVGYFDFQPFDAILPTSQWPAGIELREARHFAIPEDLLPGEYTFVIGLYLPETMQRLRIINDISGENVVSLGTVTIEGS